ncbi:MAG: hypothetical protein Q7S40_18545 [Opitutaceae bacterium]|nr:hypothetical protein [Opitutaceae bacterium]
MPTPDSSWSLAFLALASVSVLPAAARPPVLQWRQLDPLPDPVGRKGMYAGTSNGHVLLAGGSNFPVPQRAGGRKTFHRAVYVRPSPLAVSDPWSVAANDLPVGLGEGAAVTTEHGVACLGGHDGVKPVSSAFLLVWDAAGRTVTRRALPELPSACANAASVYRHPWIYVAGGESTTGPLATFWRLDLNRALAGPATVSWESLPPCPGRPRFGGIMMSVTTPAGVRLLFGGGLPGAAKSQEDYLRDAWLFDLAAGTWAATVALPRGAVLAAALSIDAARGLVLGGSDGHDFARMKEQGDRYRIPADALLYDGSTNRWSRIGTMPLGVVGAAVVDLGGSWLVAGGEYSPGLRTPRTFQLSIREP